MTRRLTITLGVIIAALYLTATAIAGWWDSVWKRVTL